MSISFKTLEENLALREALKDEKISNERIRHIMRNRIDANTVKDKDDNIPRSKITQAEIEDAEAMFGAPTRQFMKDSIKAGVYEDIIEALGMDPKDYPKEMWEEGEDDNNGK